MMEKLTVPASRESLEEALLFVRRRVKAAGCSKKVILDITLAVEEAFVNIADYAYAPGTGEVEIGVGLRETPPEITLVFADGGKPWNPLARQTPDIGEYVKKRKPGGLGIFLIQKMMDSVTYQYQNGKNVLTLSKALDMHKNP